MKEFSKKEKRSIILTAVKKRLAVWGIRILGSLMGSLIGLGIVLGLGTISYALEETRIDKFGERIRHIYMLGVGALFVLILFGVIGGAIVWLILKEKEKINEAMQEEKSKIIKEQSSEEPKE